MAARSKKAIEAVEATPLALDTAHLARMTLGDHQLEGEILQIFLRQTGMMLERIATAEPMLAAAAAHTLTGSARGIGAWRVALAAERLEQACRGASRRLECDVAIEKLKSAVLEATGAISIHLGGASRDR